MPPVRLADRLADCVTAVAGDDDELVDDVDRGVEHALEQRAITDREEGFWATICQRPHPGPAAGRKYDSVHVRSRRRGGG